MVSKQLKEAFNNTDTTTNDNEILINHEPVVYTRARRAVKKNKKTALRLGQLKLFFKKISKNKKFLIIREKIIFREGGR